MSNNLSIKDYRKLISDQMSILDSSDIEALQSIVGNLYHKGFFLTEAIDYLNCLVEFNPNLPEETALERMNKISKKVLERNSR